MPVQALASGRCVVPGMMIMLLSVSLVRAGGVTRDLFHYGLR
jgi:hypothetical protein